MKVRSSVKPMCEKCKIIKRNGKVMPLMSWATHVLQWLVQRDARPRGGANLQNQSQFGL